MVRSRDEAEGDFGELEPKLRLIPVRAFARYNDKQRLERAFFRLRTQADMIHAYMEDEARTLLRTEWSVTMSPRSAQGFFFDVLGKWRFRLHKLNDDFTIENNRTILALEFLDQAPTQPNLGLVANPTNLHLGYRLNSAKTGLASVHIVCPKGEEEIAWQYILPEPLDQGPETIPGVPSQPTGPRLRPLQPVREPGRTSESGA